MIDQRKRAKIKPASLMAKSFDKLVAKNTTARVRRRAAEPTAALQKALNKRNATTGKRNRRHVSEPVEDRGLSSILQKGIESDRDGPSIPFAEVKRQLAARRRSATKRKA